jgi:hypothetical protein
VKYRKVNSRLPWDRGEGKPLVFPLPDPQIDILVAFKGREKEFVKQARIHSKDLGIANLVGEVS